MVDAVDARRLERTRGPQRSNAAGHTGNCRNNALPVRFTHSSAGLVPTSVLAVIDETPDIRTFRTARPAGFEFLPGQFVMVRVRADGVDHARCYSISSAPEASGYLEISVKRQGLVSRALHATLRPGSTLHVMRPAGKFLYPAGDDRPVVLIAGGVGITPLISMLRHGLACEPQRPFTLLHSASTAAGLAFVDELRVLARRHPTLRWVPAVTGGDCDTTCYPGRIDEGLIRATVPGIADAICFICGPEPMIASVRAALAILGVPPPQVRFERPSLLLALSSVRLVARPNRVRLPPVV